MEKESKTKFNAAEVVFIVIDEDMSFFSSCCQGGGQKHILQSANNSQIVEQRAPTQMFRNKKFSEKCTDYKMIHVNLKSSTASENNFKKVARKHE